MVTLRLNIPLLILALLGIALFVVGIQLPDIQRYLRIRSM
ncbi:DUF6893 family small protein [Dictyobacter formicarum]|uniref:Uncharacterized protein n=1 Tax=Dictyobacter formicarum TaxID=2778368 RepID=A0ABQ3VD00_9CHLR|nr:hypothetical protein KSZ_18660 [Dictyobacter formicarum]